MSPPPPLAWVYKRDGRLVPFDADKISQALFAGTERLGQPDPFLARELTDSILHFLAAETAGTTPTTAQVADLAIKVVRELGQPALARALAQHQEAKLHPQPGGEPPASVPAYSELAFREAIDRGMQAQSSAVDLTWQSAAAGFQRFSLEEVFTRDLAAAHAEGLLTILGLEHPFELAAHTLPVPALSGSGLIEAILQARDTAGSCLALDGFEFVAGPKLGSAPAMSEWIRGLQRALQLTHLTAVLNLNCATPPAWAGELAAGPLFPGGGTPASAVLHPELADGALEAFYAQHAPPSRLRLDWHLGAADFAPAAAARLERLARLALAGLPLALVFDRPRRPLSLAEGIDRQHPAILLALALHLPQFHAHLKAPATPEAYLQRLGSLARLALSAATQKRQWLRRSTEHRPALGRGFLLERARFLVVPVGLEQLCRFYFPEGPCRRADAAQFAGQVLERLRTELQEAGRRSLLEVCLDSNLPAAGQTEAWPFWPDSASVPEEARIMGPTPWDPAAPPRAQLLTAGMLQEITGGGTLALPPGALRLDELIDLLRIAWQQTPIARLHLVRLPAKSQEPVWWEQSSSASAPTSP